MHGAGPVAAQIVRELRGSARSMRASPNGTVVLALEQPMQWAAFMRAGELCVRDVVTAQMDESVVDAARRMVELDVGDLVVVRDRPDREPHPIGIVTDRDLVVQVLARPERVPAATRIADVMHRELVTATEDDAVEDVIAKMRAHGIRRVPIVDRLGGLQGVLSIDDVLGWMRDQIQTATKLLEQQGHGPQLRARVTR